jgi:hypothetical protein
MDVVAARRWLAYELKATPRLATQIVSQEMADNFVARVEQLKHFRRSSLSGVFNGAHTVRSLLHQPRSPYATAASTGPSRQESNQ